MRNFLYSIFIIATLVAGSCARKIDDAYLNPNTYPNVPPETLLPQIISAMAGNHAGGGPMNDSRFVGAFIQNWHYALTNSSFDVMGYINSPANVAQSTWRMHYYDIGQNNQIMMQWAADQGKWDYVGVGKAIEAWSWMVISDYYGEVILKDAFDTTKVVFTYNTQEETYNHIRLLCFEALENLDKTGDGVSSDNLAKGDAYFFKGDVEKWKKFVYGILARYYNHFSNKSSYLPDSAIYYADRAMSTVDEIASVKWEPSTIGATNNYYGPFRSNLSSASTASPSAIRQSVFIANIMNGNNTAFRGVSDPRAWYLLRGNTNGTIVGVSPNEGAAVIAGSDRPESFWGVSQDPTPSNIAPPDDQNCRFIFTNSAPYPVMTAAEMKFIKAEAAFRSGDKSLALEAYKEGINAHFDMLLQIYNQNIPEGKEITPASREAYLSNPLIVPLAAGNLTMTHIMMQKYIAMWGHGVLETWMDMRRFHYQDLDPQTNAQVYADFTIPLLDSRNGGEFVYRYLPAFNSEYMWNVQELERIGAMQESYHTKKLWITEP